MNVKRGDIGPNPREYEIVPLTEPATQPVTVPAQPEQVPA